MTSAVCRLESYRQAQWSATGGSPDAACSAFQGVFPAAEASGQADDSSAAWATVHGWLRRPVTGVLAGKTDKRIDDSTVFVKLKVVPYLTLSWSRSESRQRPLQVFAPILWSALTLDTIVPAGANPLRGSVIIFAPARCCYMTSYLTLCLLIRCDHVAIVLLPEYCRNCEKGIHYGRFVGCNFCKLYKVCFCSSIFCRKLELVIR